MSFPVRCFTCNAVLAHLEPEYASGLRAHIHPEALLKTLNVTRMCCRRQFLGFVDLTADRAAFPCKNIVLDNGDTCLERQAHGMRNVSCD